MWKRIKDWENFYEINENGEIRNIKTNKLIMGIRILWLNSHSKLHSFA